MGIHDKEIREWIERVEKSGVVGRIWEKDASLWTKDPAVQKEIAARLGWLDLLKPMKEAADGLAQFADGIRQEGFNSVLLLGMGGSSLAPELFQSVFGNRPGFPRLDWLDSTDPAKILDTESRITLEKTLFIVSSKSGSTVELTSLFKYFFEKVKKGENFIAITDPGSPLEAQAQAYSFRKIFLATPDVGGRFSALSVFGLVPAALIGVDIKAILESAEKMSARTSPIVNARDNPAVPLGVSMAVLAEAGRDKLTLITPRSIASFGDWAEQLVAESTGKEEMGVVPVVREELQDAEAYGGDRFFVSVSLGTREEAGSEAKLQALEEEGHPVLRLNLKNSVDLGGEFFRWELATAIAGVLLKINPFDQPDVQAAKDKTKAILGSSWDPSAVMASEPAADFWESLKLRDYIAILAFLPDLSPVRQRLEALQGELRNMTRLAVSLGFGPRYLHSTGQLHKGGPNTGVFILITAKPQTELAVPGEKFGFGKLELAQALGDLETLKARGRRVMHFRLENLSEKSLDELCARLKSAVEAQV